MKSSDVVIGGIYTAKVSGNVQEVKIEATSPHGGWVARNMATKREVRIKSSRRLRRLVARPKSQDPPADLPPANANACGTAGCSGDPSMTYCGVPLCDACWKQKCEQEQSTPPSDAAVDAEGVPPQEPTVMEETTNPTENETMATKKKSKSGSSKKASKSKSPVAPPPAKKKKAAPVESTKRVSALDAAAQVLAKAGKPMAAKELVDAMAEQGLWSSPGGKTPHATLYAAMMREERDKGKASRFRKVDRGQFALAG